MTYRESQIRSDKTSDAQRTNYRREISDLDRKREVLRDDLVNAERDLDRLRRSAVASAVAPVARASPPAAAPAPAVVAIRPGVATGKLVVGTTEVPLRFAYTFVAPDPLDNLKSRAMLLLTGTAIPDAVVAQAPDLDRLLGATPSYVLVIRNEATPPRLSMIVWHPQLGSVAVEKVAGKSGTVKFDSYGESRIAGTLVSPQGGKNAYAWNKHLRLDVKFDAPYIRRWPP